MDNECCKGMDSILLSLVRDIQDTCLSMIRIQKKFWLKYQKSPTLTRKRKQKLKQHSLTGLKRPLESLVELACSFNDRWEYYAPCFTPFYEFGGQRFDEERWWI
ncbi:unnamed protein product [Cuscuta europaea]|uniref:Uncharacterized protein n=1 Tax=Cuscuta europaea TaxID=41803 RepID=A0A9P0YQL2_CUSEU|nr:unnamed protein product [Cuscuta europaea]